jgi:hypothetical protein
MASDQETVVVQNHLERRRNKGSGGPEHIARWKNRDPAIAKTRKELIHPYAENAGRNSDVRFGDWLGISAEKFENIPIMEFYTVSIDSLDDIFDTVRDKYGCHLIRMDVSQICELIDALTGGLHTGPRGHPVLS